MDRDREIRRILVAVVLPTLLSLNRPSVVDVSAVIALLRWMPSLYPAAMRLYATKGWLAPGSLFAAPSIRLRRVWQRVHFFDPETLSLWHMYCKDIGARESNDSSQSLGVASELFSSGRYYQKRVHGQQVTNESPNAPLSVVDYGPEIRLLSLRTLTDLERYVRAVIPMGAPSASSDRVYSLIPTVALPHLPIDSSAESTKFVLAESVGGGVYMFDGPSEKLRVFLPKSVTDQFPMVHDGSGTPELSMEEMLHFRSSGISNICRPGQCISFPMGFGPRREESLRQKHMEAAATVPNAKNISSQSTKKRRKQQLKMASAANVGKILEAMDSSQVRPCDYTLNPYSKGPVGSSQNPLVVLYNPLVSPLEKVMDRDLFRVLLGDSLPPPIDPLCTKVSEYYANSESGLGAQSYGLFDVPPGCVVCAAKASLGALGSSMKFWDSVVKKTRRGSTKSRRGASGKRLPQVSLLTPPKGLELFHIRHPLLHSMRTIEHIRKVNSMNHLGLSTVVTGVDLDQDPRSSSDVDFHGYIEYGSLKMPTTDRVYTLYIPPAAPHVPTLPSTDPDGSGKVIGAFASPDPWDIQMVMVESPVGGRISLPRTMVEAYFYRFGQNKSSASEFISEWNEQRTTHMIYLAVGDYIQWPTYTPWYMVATDADSANNTDSLHSSSCNLGRVVGIDRRTESGKHPYAKCVYVILCAGSRPLPFFHCSTRNSTSEDKLCYLMSRLIPRGVLDTRGMNPVGCVSAVSSGPIGYEPSPLPLRDEGGPVMVYGVPSSEIYAVVPQSPLLSTIEGEEWMMPTEAPYPALQDSLRGTSVCLRPLPRHTGDSVYRGTVAKEFRDGALVLNISNTRNDTILENAPDLRQVFVSSRKYVEICDDPMED